MDYTKRLLNACSYSIFMLVIAFLSFSCTDDMIFNNPFDPQVPLSAPSNLRIQFMKEFSITLQWQSKITNTGPDVAKNIQNVIEQSIDGSPFTAVDTVVSVTEATIQETFIPGKIYSFRVHTIVGSRVSANSNIINGSLSSYTPSNLNAEILSETKCRLTWKDNSISEIGFQIQRKLSSGGIYNTVGQVPADTTTFIDSTVVITDSVYYRICALYDNGKTSDYYSVTVFTSFTPSNLNANINQEILRRLSWQDHSIEEIGFRIERKTDINGIFISIGQVPRNTVQFDDTTLILADTVFYRVCAIYSDRIGEYCSLTIVNSYAPSNFNAFEVSETVRKLSWQDNSNSELGFHIERKLGLNGIFSTIGQVPANTTTFNDIGIILTDTTYEYRISADYGSGNITKYCLLDVTLPFPAPTSLQIGSLSSTSLQLYWNDNSSFESGFLIERREGSGDFNTITTTQPNATTYIDSPLDSTKEYQYRISAFTTNNRSKYIITPVHKYYIPPIVEIRSWSSMIGRYSNVFQSSPEGSAIFMGDGIYPYSTANFFYLAWNDVTIYGNTHGTNISCAAISRGDYYGNNYIATASDDSLLMIWRGRWYWGQNFAIPLTNHVVKVVFSIDGQRVFGACDDKKIRCWNTTNGVLYFTTPALGDSIAALDITSDGTYLASASGRSVTLWNASTGASIFTFPDLPDTIGLLKCSATNIGVSSNNSIQVFDIASKSVCFSSAGYINKINPFSFNTNSSLLFVGDNTDIEIWSLPDGRLIQKQAMMIPSIAIYTMENSNSFFSVKSKNDPIVTFYDYIARYIWAP